jgi:hypothetical protein
MADRRDDQATQTLHPSTGETAGPGPGERCSGGCRTPVWISPE